MTLAELKEAIAVLEKDDEVFPDSDVQIEVGTQHVDVKSIWVTNQGILLLESDYQEPPVSVIRIPRSMCRTCHGTGRVRSGESSYWDDPCDYCYDDRPNNTGW